jgi:hypothetical protein
VGVAIQAHAATTELIQIEPEALAYGCSFWFGLHPEFASILFAKR